MRKTCVALGLLLVLSCTAPDGAQKSPAKVEKEPKTKLETFQAQTGAVIIKGFSDIDVINALGFVGVKAMEFTDAATGVKQTGVSIEIKEVGSMGNTNRSFIDYDEVDSLLKGIDYISKATANVTKLSQFEATYKTKGYFSATTFSASGKIQAAVSSGSIRPATTYISLQQLGQLRSIIEQAKQKLDSVK